MALTSKEEAFCQAIAKYGEKEKVKSYIESGYSTNMSKNAIGVAAARIFNKSKIRLRIKELQKKTVAVAEKKFTITVEQRLRWLNDIVNAGLGTYTDQAGNARRENLAAAKGAIETLNNMLGTDEGSDVKPVKVFVGVEDASKP